MDLREQLQATLGSAYILEQELGGGGMSRVFVADETRLSRKVVSLSRRDHFGVIFATKVCATIFPSRTTKVSDAIS